MQKGKEHQKMARGSFCIVSILLILTQKGAPFCPAVKRHDPYMHGSRLKRTAPAQVVPRASTTLLNVSSSPSDSDENHSLPNAVLSQRKNVMVTTFNLIKAIAGSGVLALPSGVAAISNYKESLAPALVIMVALGALSAYTFSLYGRLLHVHEAKSLGELWEKEKGRSSSWVISLATLTFCFGAALSYSILLGDTASAVAAAGGLQGIFLSRSFWIVLLTSSILYPLCNLDSLLALAPLSIAGVAAVTGTTFFLGWRCPSLNRLSPYTQGCGVLLKTLAPRMIPQFNTYNKHIFSPSSSVLVGMAATSYLAHSSAPSFYESLRQTKNKSPDTQPSSSALGSFNMVTFLGFATATLLNCLVMSFGFLTFGGSSSGVILNNFSIHDPGASLCRALMAICVVGGYPFLVSSVAKEFIGLRGAQIEGQSARQAEKTVASWTLVLLTIASLVLKDAGFVIGFSGAVMGSFIVYIFPALLSLSYLDKQKNMFPINWRQKTEPLFCRVLICFGVLVAALGGGISVINSYFPHLLK